jgi:hypothetical protein
LLGREQQRSARSRARRWAGERTQRRRRDGDHRGGRGHCRRQSHVRADRGRRRRLLGRQ